MASRAYRRGPARRFALAAVRSVADLVDLKHKLLGRNDTCVPILTYHTLRSGDDPEYSPWFSVPPARFEQHLSFLCDSGYKVTTLSQAAWSAREVILTFDDGFEDNYMTALPLLTKYGLTASFFIPTGCIGVRGRRMSWAQVAALNASGMEIGSHGHSHRSLLALDDAAVAEELRLSKNILEEHVQAPIGAFAYPYGGPRDVDDRVAALVETAGYTRAVTTLIGRNTRETSPLKLRRVPVYGEDRVEELQKKLSGCYDWLGRFQKLWQ